MVRSGHARLAGGALLAAVVAMAGAWLAARQVAPAAVGVPPPTLVAGFSASLAEPIVPARWEALQSALGAAAAKVCADGCEEPPAPTAPPTAVAAAEAVALPADLDAWALSPAPLLVATATPAATRLFNTPPAPDEHDPTPADESDPYATPVEPPAQE